MTMILEQSEKALENQFPTTVLSQIEDDHQSILPTRQKRTIFGNHVRFVVLGLTMICSALITANTSTIFFTVICMDKEVEDDNVLLLSSIGANASFCNQFNDLFSWTQCKNAFKLCQKYVSTNAEFLWTIFTWTDWTRTYFTIFYHIY